MIEKTQSQSELNLALYPEYAKAKIISLISMEVIPLSANHVCNNLAMMGTSPQVFTLMQGLCHMRSATVSLIITPIHQTKPNHNAFF